MTWGGTYEQFVAEMWESMERAPAWLGDEPRPEIALNRDEARLFLYQRCLDAGWTRAKATRYLNKVLPANP